MQYLLIYDIGRRDPKIRQRINRALKRLGAVKLQQSVWESNNLAGLTLVAECIKIAQGNAMVLKKIPAHEKIELSSALSELVGWNLFMQG